MELMPDRRLGWALALSLAAHGLALTPALSPLRLEGSPPLRASLRHSPAAAPAAVPETPAAERPVEPPTRRAPPEPAERPDQKTPAAPPGLASITPAASPQDAPPATAQASTAQGDGAASPSAEPVPPQAQRPTVDLYGLRQYHLALSRMAARFKRYPPQAREAGSEGRVPLRLTVSETGMPAGIALIGTSGSPLLDRAALEMMRLAASHTPVPESLAGRAFTIDLAVDYNLRDE